MKTLFLLLLAVACGATSAQTPTANLMPDGSRDMYVGLGVSVAPDFPGASEKQTTALPLIQMQWSNGIFISGMSAGMHLSRQPDVEFGPLLAVDTGRDQDGTRTRAGGVGPLMGLAGLRQRSAGSLEGMPDVPTRLQGGAFANYYVNPALRLTSSVLYGAGHDHDGLVVSFGVQQMFNDVSPHHRVSLAAGVNIVNRSYNRSFFGISPDESVASGYPVYAPGAGVRDVYVAAGWNWALSPSWMVTSAARLSYLRNDAGHSPLVERPTNFSVSSGLVFRF